MGSAINEGGPAQGRTYDLAVVGGGINGTGIARDAAGRGASVVLFEQNDLASGTSSASTKLIHGGLRYLEHYEFRLVREALHEREVLLRAAPHIVWPLRFVLPYSPGLRPAWMLRLGLFLYDHLGGRKILPASRSLDLTSDPAGRLLKSDFRRGFEYSDCWVDDARLVVLNARDAADRGAAIRTGTRVLACTPGPSGWTIDVQPEGGPTERIAARVLVNAAGPWVDGIARLTSPATDAAGIRLVQGSHIVLPRAPEHERAYIFQNPDGRIVFAIPYEHDFALIGTTDRDVEGPPGPVSASAEEISYLCEAASEYLRKPVSPADVVWTYSGLRALYDDGATAAQEATRDYVLRLGGETAAPVLSVYGGKITTYRRLAEAALDKLAHVADWAARPAWTANAPLPGGDFPHDAVAATIDRLQREHPFLEPTHAERLVRAYGTEAWRVLGGARDAADLGETFGTNLSAREIDHLIDREWARTADDILWRRSKLGLRTTPGDVERLTRYLRERTTSPT